MIKSIIFLTVSPFNQRDFKRFGIDIFLKNGFEVEVWELTNFLYPDVSSKYIPADRITWPGHKTFENKKSALAKIQQLASDTFIICLINYNLKTFCVYKALSSSKAKYAVFTASVLPSVKRKKISRFLLYYRKYLQIGRLKQVPEFLFSIIPFDWLRIKPARLILAGGRHSIHSQYPMDDSSEILWAHVLDYDLYLEEKDKDISEKPIAVFLDEYLPFHPDLLYGSVKQDVFADKYYSLLNNFFNQVEKRLNIEVVIAAHPRSQYETKKDYFSGRRLLKGQTIQLIHESKLVLNHASAAVSMANLFLKPIIFLAFLELDQSYGPIVKEMALGFGKKVIYLDATDNVDWDFELSVNKQKYSEYRQAFIKTDQSENIFLWQIVANRLKSGV